MNVLGISGSPRRGGNTDLLLGEVIRGAESAGATTRTIILNDMNIRPCQHCDACLGTGNCIIQDDMQMVYRGLESADRIALSSPVHFMSLTAQMKAMIDRCQALWARKYRLKIPPLGDRRERKGIFIAVGGRKIPAATLFEAARVTVRTLFVTLDVAFAGELLFPAVDEKGAILLIPEALEQAYRTGQSMVN
ncbi:MAG: flavodoxin family protein [Chloroflexota bacterium]